MPRDAPAEQTCPEQTRAKQTCAEQTCADHRSGDRRIARVIFLSLWALYAYIGPGESITGPNSVTRLAFVFSALQDHLPSIDAFAAMTVDRAIFASHAYMDKAPGLSLLAMPAVALAELLASLVGLSVAPIAEGHFTPFFILAGFLATALTSALWTAATAAGLWLFARHLRASRAAAAFAALGFALCTPAFGWATVFFSHAVAGACLFLGLVLAVLATEPAPPPAAGNPNRLACVAGALLSWAVVVEFTAAAAVALIAAAALWRLRALPPRDRRVRPAAALAGGLAAFLPLIAYNLWAFGTPAHFGYSDVVGFDGMKQGLFGVSLPRPEVLWALLFGIRRGLVWLSPLLALIPLAWLACRHRLAPVLLAVLIAVPLATLLIVSGYAYWDGGASTGPRHVIPALPFACLALAPLWDHAGHRARIAMLCLALVSFALSLIAASVDMTALPGVENPLADILLPRFLAGDIHTLLILVGGHGLQGLLVVPLIALIGWRAAAPRRAPPSGLAALPA